MDDTLIGSLAASTLRVSTPLVLGALAGCLSERAGVIDLGLEGKMLASAFVAGCVGAISGQWALAMGAAVVMAVALSMLQGYACVTHQGDQVVAGMAITMTVAGMTVVLGAAWFGKGGQTSPLSEAARGPIGAQELGLWLQSLGEVGRTLSLALSGHHALVYVALACVWGVWWLLYRTRFGLRLRATGENPAMVDAAGVSVAAIRYSALALNGVLCGLAGGYLVTAMNSSFIPHMTAGRGYMALAALIFGKWHPAGALAACLLFGFLDACSIRMQGVSLPAAWGGGAIPVQAIQALPYVLTVVLLAGFMGRSRAPRALGIAYVKER